ncbi:glycosyltransferase family 4 protein [Anabaenopsis arnoldii]|uniref:Glycosyltransferase family 4 protein n=1 Tax=Anabaenopsis arnoldii TaxID=2152938 RepID=A0ABT5AVG6_9CYAN|nr:glycosyltransferase family 4 protein [Anabaenopsis arnoldii]MDB9540932.1 glycosyltransferase family 4 protein [Anabaenopsis arnoldii]MDH6093369.1 glycosyltransferase family 4 protein [Anabaenopsis arnoldii]
MINQSYKLLFMSTGVGALGSGLGGGIELTMPNIVKEMLRRGHTIDIVAPKGSLSDSLPLIEIPGNTQNPAQDQKRDEPICIPHNSVLANMWTYAYQVQGNYDLILNFSYDWLPLYLTQFFDRPVAHLISMSSLLDAMDEMITQVATRFPGSIGVHSQAQAATFACAEKCVCVLNGLDLSLYQFCDQPGNSLAWVGRIAPEKGLEDAVAAANSLGMPLKIFGLLQNEEYWQQVCQDYPDAQIEYKGFVTTSKLQQELGQCQALLFTPRWVEAFGNVAIEALACGVPVIAYRRGGLVEIVEDGKTGFLVEPDSVQGLIDAIKDLHTIDRRVCRQQAEVVYSLAAMGDRVEKWFQDILSR